MRIVQFINNDGSRAVARVEDSETLAVIDGVNSTYELAQAVISRGGRLADLSAARMTSAQVDYAGVVEEGRLLSPLDHPDPAHLLVTGTGLTHLGSAHTRDHMHKKVAESGEENLTDTMKMFRWGMEGGKPAATEIGVQPEWFYKGDGSIVVAPGADLPNPDFAKDGGEEPEIVGLYMVDANSIPWRIGFALGNEFSDHVTEHSNYLYLAHSKLRPCAFGPELLIGELSSDLRGTSRLLRQGNTVWESEFLTGEAHMSHTIANLEHHHFKYSMFRRPGDIHAHFFGTATLSFGSGIRAHDGDIFEISIPAFGRPLRNRLTTVATPRGDVRTIQSGCCR